MLGNIGTQDVFDVKGDAQVEAVAKRFGIPTLAVQEIKDLDPEVLAAWDEVIPNNITDRPRRFTRYPLGSASIEGVGQMSERYVNFLDEFDPAKLETTEAEQGIKNHPTYRTYLQWAKEGKKPPYIFVATNDNGTRQSSNRRRVLVTKELGQRIEGWHGVINPETKNDKRTGIIPHYNYRSSEMSHSADI
jgi:hypothetical protein